MCAHKYFKKKDSQLIFFPFTVTRVSLITSIILFFVFFYKAQRPTLKETRHNKLYFAKFPLGTSHLKTTVSLSGEIAVFGMVHIPPWLIVPPLRWRKEVAISTKAAFFQPREDNGIHISQGHHAASLCILEKHLLEREKRLFSWDSPRRPKEALYKPLSCLKVYWHAPDVSLGRDTISSSVGIRERWVPQLVLEITFSMGMVF